MIGFPGAIYDAEGISLIEGLPDLTQEQIDQCEHRSVVTRDAGAADRIGQVWLLADDATFAAVPRTFQEAAIALLSVGRAILILSRRPEPGADMREGLLEALAMADTQSDTPAARRDV